MDRRASLGLAMLAAVLMAGLAEAVTITDYFVDPPGSALWNRIRTRR